MACDSFVISDWSGSDSDVSQRVAQKTESILRAYREDPVLVEEHANLERFTAQGGYGQRQIFELVQNGADELLRTPGGKIHVLLTDDTLYVANEGTPIQPRGVDAILSAALSVKRSDEIGRFGLGFKSVLGVTEMPDFFSRSGAFRFDAEWSEMRIREIVPDTERTPVLRTARHLDAGKAAALDPTLCELMSWASSIVRLPVDRDESDWLADHILAFPREFLVFAPHVGELILEDRPEEVFRTIRLERDGDLSHLFDGSERSTWQVFKTIHRPSDEARKTAGELADREEVPIIWAVPTEGRGRTDRGQFWAFFPTHYRTTVSGILNAPWKTNEDRQNLLEGPFNDELLKAASDLIVDSLAELSRKDDPAAHLDVMPARGRESPNWADDEVTRNVYTHAAGLPSLPNQDGVLTKPGLLKLHPAVVNDDALQAWTDYPRRPVDWCHPRVETRERRPRAERLILAARGQIATTPMWLETLAQTGGSQGSIAALRVARFLIDGRADLIDHVQMAAIVLTTDGDLVEPDQRKVAIAGDYRPSVNDLSLVHPDLMEDPEARSVLARCGVTEADPLIEMRALIASYLSTAPDTWWERFWSVLRSVEPSQIAQEIQSTEETGAFGLKARAADGTFRPYRQLLSNGPIVSEVDSEDASSRIDSVFHAEDSEILHSLGIRSVPEPGGGSDHEAWFPKYVHAMRTEYTDGLKRQRAGRQGTMPQPDLLEFVEAAFVGPLEPLIHLSEEAAARFTDAMLKVDSSLEPWHIHHRTRRDSYPTIEVQSPALWMLKRSVLNSTRGSVQASEAVAPFLERWGDYFPVVAVSDSQADALDIPRVHESLTGDYWRRAFTAADRITDDRSLGRFWAFAAEHVGAPDLITCRVGDNHAPEPPANVTVVCDERDLRALQSESVPVLFVTDSVGASHLIERWGLYPAEHKVRTELVHVPSSLETPLTDRWPLLTPMLTSDARKLKLIPCEVLNLVTLTTQGKIAEPIRVHIDTAQSEIYYADDESEFDLLQRISDELRLGLAMGDIGRVIEQRLDDVRRQRARDIAAEPDSGKRLVELIGEDAMSRHLPASLIESASDMFPDDERLIPELAIASFGVGVLREFREELESAGWNPPQQWTGRPRAIEWATTLGFGPEYAGFRGARRDPVLAVDGPLELPELHDFQRELAEKIRTMLRRQENARALVALPTGAGKTRLAVQTLIDAMKDGELESPLLWVAQTDELCEQAVQSWQESWRADGPSDRLHISRLWASNDATHVDGSYQVVVATIAKLEHCFGHPAYEWLWDSKALIIDEAHTSITPAYTRLLTEFDMARGKHGVPLLGLTATPFRGTSEVETKRLAIRYGKRRLDEAVLGENPYRTLQEMGVLAKVDHALLEGASIELSEAERDEVERLNRVPAAVGDRIGSDADRNRTLLSHIQSLPDDWPVLLFAASVEHAQALAALLSLSGISAAAISAQTEPGARKHYIKTFRAGKLRVLTNYGVLTQGFDAPAVRAVYVARPTFSPNVYQQMIGRGLRGPKNGGKEVCLIVNVADTFRNFGKKLAFTEFDYLWESGD